MKYLLGTSYFTRDAKRDEWFYLLWLANNMACKGDWRLQTIEVAGSKIPASIGVQLKGDLGHQSHIVDGKKPYRFCSWSATFAALAMIAYCDESDFIYKEQDCLAFGPWVEKMYEDLGDGGIVFGKQANGDATVSLALIRHSYIPEFVSWFMGSEAENTHENCAELKFKRYKESNPMARYLSFGFDRDRPLDYAAPVWYAQKFTPAELLKMREEGLIDFDGLPEGVTAFTNNWP